MKLILLFASLRLLIFKVAILRPINMGRKKRPPRPPNYCFFGLPEKGGVRECCRIAARPSIGLNLAALLFLVEIVRAPDGSGKTATSAGTPEDERPAGPERELKEVATATPTFLFTWTELPSATETYIHSDWNYQYFQLQHYSQNYIQHYLQHYYEHY